MLSPRLTNCPECANIPSLLRKIDCKLAELGNNLYNNISYMLNKPVPADDILQLIGYRRILQYKYINPNYACRYTINMIASRVIRLTVGCVSRCNTPEPCIEVPCNVTIVPNPTTTSTTTFSPIIPTTTTTSSTTIIIPITTTTSTSSSGPTTTTTSTTNSGTTTTTTSTTAAPTTTTSTTYGTTTSTTTVANIIVINSLVGLKIETIYMAYQSDLDKLPPTYIHPCPEQIGAHGCNRGFFEVKGNGVYIGDSLMNNGAGVGGEFSVSGKHVCEDYNNYPAALTGGTWTGWIGISGGSRYSTMTITQQKANDIANAYPGHCDVQFQLISAMDIYNQGIATCDDLIIPHENVTWTRISKPDGTVIYNGCPINNIASINICV